VLERSLGADWLLQSGKTVVESKMFVNLAVVEKKD